MGGAQHGSWEKQKAATFKQNKHKNHDWAQKRGKAAKSNSARNLKLHNVSVAGKEGVRIWNWAIWTEYDISLKS